MNSLESFTKYIDMKNIFILSFLALLILQSVKGQKNDTSGISSPQALHDMFMHKRAANNTVGWLMLGSGVGLAIAGIAINLDSGFNIDLSGGNAAASTDNNSKGLWLSYLGGAMTLASIPFFISAHDNKIKAKLALKGESVSTGHISPENVNFAAIALVIKL
jgi:hypothetical protein